MKNAAVGKSDIPLIRRKTKGGQNCPPNKLYSYKVLYIIFQYNIWNLMDFSKGKAIANLVKLVYEHQFRFGKLVILGKNQYVTVGVFRKTAFSLNKPLFSKKLLRRRCIQTERRGDNCKRIRLASTVKNINSAVTA